MAPPKRGSRARAASDDDADSDFAGNNGGDTEPEQLEATPRARRTMTKRRLSEYAGEADADASFGSDGGARQPLKAVNMNDDAAEKRRRRKSTKISLPNLNDDEDPPQAGPSNEGADAQGADAPEGPRRPLQRLQSVAQIPAINVPLDVMSSNFEEWMKMATDNKINAANSWNFALIDYFHDMSLLRNQSDNSINFQRASCTLDGCVKIWTSRVDSVGTETGKLLSNLAQEGKHGDEDEEGAGSDDPDGGAAPGTQRKKKARGPGQTLAKDAAQLRSKKLDLEFSVDPLFKKTCADFDEGGAQGLLMSHLSLGLGPDGGMRVVFDASDSVAKDAEEDEEALLEPEETIDLSYLRSQFLPDIDVLNEKAISHSLASFSFSKDAFAWDDTSYFQAPAAGAGYDDDDDHDGGNSGGDAEAPIEVDGGAPVEDFFVGDQAVTDDYAGGIDDFGGGGGDDDGDNGSVGAVAAHEGGGPGNGGVGGGAFVPFDPRQAPNERDLVMAMTDADGGMLDYFDQAFLKNWAGPEHWKLRKVVRKPDAIDAAGASTKPRREKKEAFKIDFLTPAEKDLKQLSKELFAPVTRGAGINLPGTSATAKARKGKGKKAAAKEKDKDLHLLPDDMHFTSRQLITLFLKPKFSLKMRGQRAPPAENADGEIDENFWAQAAANQAGGGQGEGDDAAGNGAIPFNTQFFHDDYDDGPGFDDAFDGGSAAPADMTDPGEQDLLAATAGQTRRVRPEFVNYAKRAKRVDVRKLKENIWKGLEIVVPEPREPDEMETEEDETDKTATDPADARQFSSVVDGLRGVYPREKMEEISTSFCFICLLHLANERGLRLEVGEDGALGGIPDPEAEVEVLQRATQTERKVGDIWRLKVYRDPEATPAA